MKLPRNRKKMPAYRGLSLTELINLKIPDKDKLSTSKINTYLTLKKNKSGKKELSKEMNELLDTITNNVMENFEGKFSKVFKEKKQDAIEEVISVLKQKFPEIFEGYFGEWYQKYKTDDQFRNQINKEVETALEDLFSGR